MELENPNKRIFIAGWDVENDDADRSLLSGKTVEISVPVKMIPTQEKLVKKLVKYYKKSGLKPTKEFSLEAIAELSLDILTDSSMYQ